MVIRERMTRHGIRRGENAAVHRNEVGRKDHCDWRTGHVAQGLFDFRRMAVRADAICRNAFVAFGEVKRRFRRSAAAGNAALAVHDDGRQFDVTPGHERREPEYGSLRIAAGVGH